MSGIFISYRREDTTAYARLLSEALGDHFGPDKIFRDVDTLAPGVDFPEAIADAVGRCDIMLVLIGRKWLTVKRQGKRRIDDPEDYVCLEITAALERDMLIVPILIEDARMPSRRVLPELLAELADRNAFRLTDDGWNDGVRRLVRALDKGVTPAGADPGPPTATAPAPIPAPPGPTVSEWQTTPADPPPGSAWGTHAGAQPGGQPSRSPETGSGRRRVTMLVGAAVAAVIVIVVLVLAATGGGGGGGGEATPPTSRSGSPALESIGLTVADVPIGWTVNPPATAFLDTPFSRCVGGPDQRTWPRAASPTLSAPDGSQGASSAAVRAPTPDAAASLHAALADHYVTCATANAENFAFAPGARLRSVEPHDIAAPSGVRAIAFRAGIEVPAGTSTVETNIDTIHLQRGDVEVEMDLIGNGQPFPSDAENRIVQTVGRRMG